VETRFKKKRRKKMRSGNCYGGSCSWDYMPNRSYDRGYSDGYGDARSRGSSPSGDNFFAPSNSRSSSSGVAGRLYSDLMSQVQRSQVTPDQVTSGLTKAYGNNMRYSQIEDLASAFGISTDDEDFFDQFQTSDFSPTAAVALALGKRLDYNQDGKIGRDSQFGFA
jgi:hypothetical protein